ncbi:MAG TPA: isoprenylcysteine carboxylmethyltransferase family protein [Terracidiphilus sp.]|jgi:protein-S-isoprenylcysteine O-methyltransferase Ste14
MFLRILGLSLYCAWIVLEVVIAIGTRTWRSQGKLHDRGSQLILWVVILASFTTAGWVAQLVPNMDFHLPSLPLRIVTVALLAAGLAIRLTAIVTLGRSFSANVAIRSSQTVLRKGLYRVVRHPSYLGLEIIFLAAGLRLHNWISLAIILVPPTAALIYRMHVEEAALLGAFGSDYADYMKTTKRLIPGVY